MAKGGGLGGRAQGPNDSDAYRWLIVPTIMHMPIIPLPLARLFRAGRDDRGKSDAQNSYHR